MSTQLQLREGPFMTSAANEVSIVFERTTHCRGAFNEGKAQEEVIARISRLGQDFYGSYTVLVGDLATIAFLPPFSWKAYDRKQRGIGFVLGQSTDGTVQFPARCFSLVAPQHIDIEEMWHLLNDRRVTSLPKLIPVTAVSEPVAVASAVMQVTFGDNPLAVALIKERQYAVRLSESQANCDALRAEIAQLEQEVAQKLSLESLVNERLKLLGLLS